MPDAGNLPAYSSNKAGLYLYPVCILGVVALALVVVRTYIRLRRTGKLYLDDWLIVAAEILSVVDTAIAIAAVTHGWGKPSYMFTPTALKETLRLQFALQVVWIITLCLVRVSVACSLLRLETEKRWRMPLYSIMSLQVLISSSYIVIQFGQCTPISANWDNVPDVKCWDTTPIVDYGWAIAAIYIVMDLALSLMPIRLIRSLHRSRTEKILVGVLMSLGLLATAVACVKMSTFNDFGKGDVMQLTIKPSMLARLEEIVGIIACSLPCLKSTVETVLKNLGIMRERGLTTPSFVNAMSLPGVGDQRDDSGYGVSGKGSVLANHRDVTPGSSTQHFVTQAHIVDASRAV
ncbi:uncharacterized protein EKO05_0003596 [Ascochyta rabiei]|uniref:Uncharacterized protein n=1 Tax=Didymella rabiei TaxID=5454 RepID=A0A163LVZ2_DIDRA|nr:uncharacterized protein EKO05_0003596 [Ascochyta rabiei]KZM28170.1 hypothetical protein ST47_g686 [Ascochyta rabiei]UPX13068.1 hypothetical protein EKO05_0003596 [Ascochyta rabiei]